MLLRSPSRVDPKDHLSLPGVLCSHSRSFVIMTGVPKRYEQRREEGGNLHLFQPPRCLTPNT